MWSTPYPTDFDWVGAFSMSSWSEAHEALSLWFAKDSVLSACIFDNANDIINGRLHQKLKILNIIWFNWSHTRRHGNSVLCHVTYIHGKLIIHFMTIRGIDFLHVRNTGYLVSFAQCMYTWHIFYVTKNVFKIKIVNISCSNIGCK